MIFKDVFSGDEMFSSSYECEQVDEVAYCVTGRYSPVYSTNKDDGTVTVRTAIDVVEEFGLQHVSLSRTDFLAHLNAYTHKLRRHLRNTKRFERLEIFEANIQGFCRRMICRFGEFSFYTGRSKDLDEGLGMCFYKEDQITPHFYFFMDSMSKAKPTLPS